jgi:hypothetical protein
MKNGVVFYLILALLAFSCKQPNRRTLKNESNSSKVIRDSQVVNNALWYDSLVLNYITKTDDELIKMARKDTIPEEWLLDDIKDTDMAKYYVFHIGHDVEDSDGSNKRFVTDGWVYIDSLTRKIYELNVQNDSLVEWKK